jgi:uncharacterized membrane protein YgcG
MSSPSAETSPVVDRARQAFADALLADAQALLDALIAAAHDLADLPAERALAQQRFDMVQDVRRDGAAWPVQLREQVHRALEPLARPLDSSAGQLITSLQGQKDLSLVDDITVRREIAVSRLSLAVMDLSTWEVADLRARVMKVIGQSDFSDDDLFRPQVMARCCVRAWLAAGLTLDAWQMLEPVLHKQLARRAQAGFHEANRLLVEQGVMPEIDLRPLIRRSDGTPTQAGRLDELDEPAPTAAPTTGRASLGASGPAALPAAPAAAVPDSWRRLFPEPAPMSSAGAAAAQGQGGSGAGGGARGGVAGAGGGGGGGAGSSGTGPAGAADGSEAIGASTRHGLDEETRLMTRPVAGVRLGTDVVLERFGQIVERHLPGFLDSAQAQSPSAPLAGAMARAQQNLARQVDAGVDSSGAPVDARPEAVLRDLQQRQRELKQAASTPGERATIELVALLFQSILTDDRIPATIRVWFARLQMPVLRVAIAEPDFFSSEDHPARRLIDRMGACVMGFEGGGTTEAIGPGLQSEIKRIVQVVEAFPDTGRRVFQTVLNEFEKFLASYYADRDDTTRMGISLAQQVEQRETLAIQYTIELRRLISGLPVHEGVRDFLFHVWADVLATAAIRQGPQSPEIASARDAATELIWTATAKTSREERAEVIRRLPPLLATLRQGMNSVGMAQQRQEDAIKALNIALTAAFGARAATVSQEQFDQLKQRLEAIEELIPDDDFEIDDSWVLDEGHHGSEGLEVVADGGSMPSPAMIEWATQLRLGDTFTLDFRGRQETVRLVWQGMHRQLTLFAASGARCMLFQKARLAAFLQAGLLLPLHDESLTASATREALRRLEADPGRLLAD